MLTLLSPSKTQDFSGNIPDLLQHTYTQPVLLEKSRILVDTLRQRSISELKALMEVSENIATLNYNRYQDFSVPFEPGNARQALLAFKGDVYTDIAVDSYSQTDFAFAQEHLRILSGLYGLLQPLDLIQPYRLEMKTKLKNPVGKDLYQFWGTQLTEVLNQQLAAQSSKYLINLASNEYFKALQPQGLRANIITPVFKEQKGDTYKMVAIYAKRARGMMADYIIQQRIDDPDALKAFSREGYSYSEPHSQRHEWVFIR